MPLPFRQMTTGAQMVTDEARRLKGPPGKIDPETGSNSAVWTNSYNSRTIPGVRGLLLVVRDEIGCQTVRDVCRQADEMASSIVGIGRAHYEPCVDQPLDQALRTAR